MSRRETQNDRHGPGDGAGAARTRDLAERSDHQAAGAGSAPVVGVLALQGDFDAHARALAQCGAQARDVRLPEALADVHGLVLPGGESTTLLRLMREHGFDRDIPRFLDRGGVIYGTCAGAILLARRVLSPEQWSLGLLDVEIERNAYGRQVDSFETELTSVDSELRGEPGAGAGAPLPAIFIRAPRILSTGASVRTLASLGDEPVLVRQGPILASTYHPELTSDRRVHRYFLRMVAAGKDAGVRGALSAR